MSKQTQNFYKYVTVEDPDPRYGNVTVENTKGFSLHLNDQVMVKMKGKDHYRAGRVIRRTNLYLNVNESWEISHTANQFPVADRPVQPELPVVPNSVRLHEVTKELENLMIQLRMLI